MLHMWTSPHLSTLMVNKQIPGAFLLLVGDLQAVSVAHLLGLENCVQVLHVDHTFGNLGLSGGGGQGVSDAQYSWLCSSARYPSNGS